MKNTTRLLNSTFIVALSCLCQLAKAQIIYTVANTGSICHTNPTCLQQSDIDLNNDGTNDFHLTTYANDFVTSYQNSASASVSITPLDSNKVEVKPVVVSHKIFARGLDFNEQTPGGSPYTYTQLTSALCYSGAGWCSCVSFGYWGGDAIEYLGVQLRTGGKDYYGWIRASVAVSSYYDRIPGGFIFKAPAEADAHAWVYDYAYNPVPNQSILAGEGIPPCVLPPSTAITPFGALCEGGDVTLSADGFATQFQWNRNGMEITGATNHCYTASDSGTYTCTVTNSCGTITSDSFVVTVYENPQATISPSGAITMCEGTITTLSANSGNNLSYQWERNEFNIASETNSTLAVTQEGNYRAIVTNTNTGCRKISKFVKVSITCKAANELTAEIHSVFPNPFSPGQSGYTTISFSLPEMQNVSLKIFDVEGRLISTLADEIMNEGTNQLSWDARDENGNAVSAGIYFLKMQTANQVKTISLSVMK